MNPDKPSSKNILLGRVKLLLILACFIGPLAAAFLGHFNLLSLRPDGLSNHARLISPPVTFGAFSQTDDSGQPLTLTDFRTRWSIVHRLGEHCDHSCNTALYNTRQVRLALGRDTQRIQRVILSPRATLLQNLAAAHPDARRAGLSDAALRQQIDAIYRTHSHHPADAILIDPLGNAMMVIPAQLDPRLLLKDLKKLMKISRIG